MVLPVEIATQRPDEIVDVRKVISQFAGSSFDLARRGCHLMGNVVELLHQVEHLFHGIDRNQHFVAHGQHIGHAFAHVGQAHRLGGTHHADLKGNRRMLKGHPLRPGDRLHPLDPGHVQDLLGDLVDDEHPGRISHVLIALDQQHLGVHPGWAKVPVGGRG